jgi:RNA polymerase sigma-70 factor (ECF subfamily)
MPNLLSDTEDLMEQARRGDALARHRLLEQHRDYLRRIVAARLGRRLAPRIVASEVVEEALIEADRRLDEYLRDGTINFHAWLRQIAWDRITEAHRFYVASRRTSLDRSDESSVALARFLLAGEMNPNNPPIHQEELEPIQRVIGLLPAENRELLVRRYIEQLSVAEIAATLGISKEEVRDHLVYGLLRLQTLMRALDL